MEIDELKHLDSIHIKHFSVDVVDKKIYYNRKLKDGSGDSLYGLEIANSLEIGSAFMKKCFEIRSLLEKKNTNILNTKKSKYNPNLYVDECKICKKQEKSVGPLHTHHLNHQKDADKCGIIDGKHFHKNIIHNLVILCSKCHQNVHKGIIKV